MFKSRNYWSSGVPIFGIFFVTVVLIIVGIFVLTIWSRVMAFTHRNDPGVEEEARNWASGLGMQVVGVQCSPIDTDGDGYISCSVSYRSNDNISVIPIECLSTYLPGSGCRVQKPLGYRGNRSTL